MLPQFPSYIITLYFFLTLYPAWCLPQLDAKYVSWRFETGGHLQHMDPYILNSPLEMGLYHIMSRDTWKSKPVLFCITKSGSVED